MLFPGPPILELPSRDRIKLADSINIVSFKILKSDVDYPISVFGTVLVRDQFDYKCIYVFRRDKDNAQVIYSPVSEISYVLYLLQIPVSALKLHHKITFCYMYNSLVSSEIRLTLK
jgi:hypothetical protein